MEPPQARTNTPAYATIPLNANWDATLSYDVLEQDAEASEMPVFVGRPEMLGPIVNAIAQPSRRGTYLISGYRGAGKTSLVTEAARQARTKLEADGWQLLPVVLNVSEVSASLSDISDAAAGPLQIDAQRLLIALLRALRNKVPEEEPEEEKAPDARPRSRRVWDTVFPREEMEPPKTDNELLVAKIEETYEKATSTQYIERSQQRLERNRREVVEKRMQFEVKNVFALVATVTGILSGIGFVAAAVGGATVALYGIAGALAVVAVGSFARSRVVTRSEESREVGEVESTRDKSIHQLENDLKDIFTLLHRQKKRTIVVLEELDKVDDTRGRQLDAVIRYFKNLFTQAPALFFFLTDKQYYDVIAAKIDTARRRRTYSIEHTFFTHRVFVNRPTDGDCLDYLAEVARNDGDKDAIRAMKNEHPKLRVRRPSDPDEREIFIRTLLLRSQHHIFDLKNEMRKYLRVDDGKSRLEWPMRGAEDALQKSERGYAALQFLLEQKVRQFAFPIGNEYANEVLRNCLYAVFEGADSAASKKVDSNYPLTGPAGDRLTASEQESIENAVKALVTDLDRGGAIDLSQDTFTWLTNASVVFSPEAELDRHEADLRNVMKTTAERLSMLANDGRLAGVVSNPGDVEKTIKRLKDEVEDITSAGTPLPEAEATARQSSVEAEAAKTFGEAFAAHQKRLEARLVPKKAA